MIKAVLKSEPSLKRKFEEWESQIQKYKDFRHSMAHKKKDSIKENKLHYPEIRDLLHDLESVLNVIESKVLQTKVILDREPSETLSIFKDLKQILSKEIGVV